MTENAGGLPWWWRATDEDEDDIDDDWDWDTELGLLDPGPDPAPPRPWVAPAPHVSPPLARDVRVAVLDPAQVGEFVRTCRAAVGWSQRELAAAVGVPQSTVARLEADRDDGGDGGRAGDGGAVRLATVCRVAAACGVTLVGLREPVDGGEPELLRGDAAQRHRDNAGRMLPAHLVNAPVQPWFGGWWGDGRYTHRRGRPERGYRLHHRYRELPPAEDAAPADADPGS